MTRRKLTYAECVRYVIGDDRETGRAHLLGNLEPSNFLGTKSRPVWSPSSYIPLKMRKSPFFTNLRVVEQKPEGY